jgi:AcrR family transcriptional regulator
VISVSNPVPGHGAGSGAAATDGRLRREPQQARARARIEHVLATADRLLAEEGAGALTTTRVAAAAGISVGSLYQWFPDKSAIAEALALRYVREFEQVAERLAEAAERDGADDPAATWLHAFTAAFRARPGFRAMWFGGLRTERLRDLTRPGLEVIAGSLERVLRVGAPDASPDVLAATAAMTVTTADALLRAAFREDPDGDRRLLDEATVMLRAYLAQRLEAR